MSSHRFFEEVEARLSTLPGDHWEVIALDEENAGVEVVFADGHRTAMDLTRASQADIQFIGHSRSDVALLLSIVRRKATLSPQEATAIEARCRAASSAPWTAYIEGENMWSGSSYIQTADDQTADDQFEIWLDNYPVLGPVALSSDQRADYAILRFVASARQDIPALLAIATGS